MPGEYTIMVEVVTAFEDANTTEVETVAQYRMRLKANGEPQATDGNAGGCAASASSGNGLAALFMVALFGGLGLIRVRRRR